MSARVIINRTQFAKLGAKLSATLAQAAVTEGQRLARERLHQTWDNTDNRFGKSYEDSFPRTVLFGNAARFMNTAPHAIFIEGGTDKHIIRSRDPFAPLEFFWERYQEDFVGPIVNHPGTPAYHIMRDAMLAAMAATGITPVGNIVIILK